MHVHACIIHVKTGMVHVSTSICMYMLPIHVRIVETQKAKRPNERMTSAVQQQCLAV